MAKLDDGFTIKLPKKGSNNLLLPIFAVCVFLFVSIALGMYIYEPAPNIASTKLATPILAELQEKPSIQSTELSASKEAQEEKTVQTDNNSASSQVASDNKSESSSVVAPVQEFKQLVNFDFDSTEIKPYDEQSLQKFLAEHKDKKIKIMIDGHTDSVGDEEYNQDLSERRANSVEQEILKITKQQHNITKKITGYGETKPVDSNDNTEGRAHNRRVELTITILS